jgi:hypothetical protein
MIIRAGRAAALGDFMAANKYLNLQLIVQDKIFLI